MWRTLTLHHQVALRTPVVFVFYVVHFSNSDAALFELRCHLFQARAVLPADDTGLSDPFVRILFKGQSRQTRVINFTNFHKLLIICRLLKQRWILFGTRRSYLKRVKFSATQKMCQSNRLWQLFKYTTKTTTYVWNVLFKLGFRVYMNFLAQPKYGHLWKWTLKRTVNHFFLRNSTGCLFTKDRPERVKFFARLNYYTFVYND